MEKFYVVFAIRAVVFYLKNKFSNNICTKKKEALILKALLIL
jgi:hypothetical protein